MWWRGELDLLSTTIQIYISHGDYSISLCSTDNLIMEPYHRLQNVFDTRVRHILCIFKSLSCVRVSCPFKYYRVCAT